ncbi:MAG: VOC family protein [Parvularculaceae bacterium]
MKRLHIHLKTTDLDESIRYYTALFGQPPVKQEPDYAKWLLDDPAANISVSTRGEAKGVGHVGFSLDTPQELEDIAARMHEAGAVSRAEVATTCCYAKSHKYWLRDPQDVAWELFHSYAEAESYGADPLDVIAAAPPVLETACCAPTE